MHVPTIALTVLAATAALLAQPSASVSGQYMEDRTMRVYACPCEWSTDWANRGREAVLAWNIQTGDYDGIPLSGLHIAAVLLGRASLTEPSTPRRSVLYLDSASTAQQRDAGLRWLLSRYRHLLGTVIAVKVLPVLLDFNPESLSLDAGSALTLRMRRASIENDTQPWAQLIHEPFVELDSPVLATTTHVKYSGPELKIRWTRDEDNITGYFGSFAEQVGP